MGEEFTFQNVRIVAQAIANYLRERFAPDPVSVIVNYDTRFLSERFAFEASKVLSHNQIHVFLAERDAPSQAASYQIIKRGAQAGINFTASFNPPEYNGLKLNLETGAPALPKETDLIEKEIRSLLKGSSVCPFYPKMKYVEKIDLRDDYLAYIQPKIDFELIRKSGIKVGVDLLYGTSREYMDEILEENGVPFEEIHGYIDPYFGGIAPSCTEENLHELKDFVREKNCSLGVSFDADGDRFGIVDDKGRFITPNLILSLILDYVVRDKKWRGGITRSVATTHLLDRIARRFELPVYKTPVGFKYIADLFLQKKIIFGGEESASLAVKDHLPEKDGIMAALLVIEMMAARGKNISDLIKDVFHVYGKRYCGQEFRPLDDSKKNKLNSLIASPPKIFRGRNVLNVETIDGIKIDFADDDWILLRYSGTEPVIRCYAEAGTQEDLNDLIQAGWEMLSQ